MVDQFKKQVMFLHPEPSLMEPCAAMLGDQYSVHMAASGTEALTTLGITPIDIIVSAQDLPGMTGQEALREAKKRSPQTRGILIANSAMTEDDMAALVTVKHLNQILNANVSSAEICAAILHELKLRQTEQLPKPANDHSAGPREGTASTGSFRTDSMRVAGDATGSYEALKGDIPVLEPGMSAEAQSRAISEVELVVLTNDSSFLKTIRAATGASHVVNHAPNLQEAVDVVEEGRSGVLITDAAVAVKDVETITAKLRRHMPSLVTIVAGRREDGEKMMGLISDGLVYRFLLKPISPGRSRLAIEASAKKHLTLLSTDVPLTPNDVQEKMTETGIIKGVTFDSGLFRTTDVRETNINMPSLDDDHDPSLLGRFSEMLRSVPPLALAAGAIVLTLVGVFALGGSDDPANNPPAPVSTAQPAPASSDAVTRQPSLTQSERFSQSLDRAETALAEGRLVSPQQDNAVFHFAQAAALNRDDLVVRERLESTLQRVFTGIENDLLADNLDSAAASLAVLNANVPGHPRLAFFNLQVNKEQSRRDLARVEQLLAAGDTDAARTTIDALDTSGVVEPTIIDALRARLATTADRSSGSTTTVQQPVADTPVSAAPAEDLQTLLDAAELRMARGQWVTPANDSARFYYEAVLDIDENNTEATAGLQRVTRELTAEARRLIQAGDTTAAQQALNAAVLSGANAIEVESIRRQIEAAASTPNTSARPSATTASPTRPAATTSSTANAASDSDTSLPPPPPATILREAATVASANNETTLPEATTADPQAGTDAVETETATASTVTEDFELVVVSTTPPQYPRSAQRRGIEGWVDVQFSVGVDGTTRDISVFDSAPGSIFDRAAVDAVAKWRYEPLPTDDPDAVKRARVRLEFDLEQ
ncbi:MAG: TonB family protein [Pseudomonadota bacterium]